MVFDGLVMAVPGLNIRRAASIDRLDPQHWSMVVLLHRDVRFVSRLLPRRVLAAYGVVCWRANNTVTVRKRAFRCAEWFPNNYNSKQPLFVITALLGIFAIFKPYPSLADVSLFFALLPLYRHVFPLLRYGFIAAAALLYATFLGPAFWHLWIYAGSGNANFFYAITLVWSLGLSIIVADIIYAVIRDELDVERPELYGKDVRQI